MPSKKKLFLSISTFIFLISLFTFEVYSKDGSGPIYSNITIIIEKNSNQDGPSSSSSSASSSDDETESKNDLNSMISSSFISSIPDDVFVTEVLSYLTRNELYKVGLTSKSNAALVRDYIDFIPYMVDESKKMTTEIFIDKKEQLISRISQYVLPKYKRNPPKIEEFTDELKEHFEPGTGAKLKKWKGKLRDHTALVGAFSIAMISTETNPMSLLSSDDAFDNSLGAILSAPFVAMATSACACVTYYVKKLRAIKIKDKIKMIVSARPQIWQERFNLAERDQLRLLDPNVDNDGFAMETREKINNLIIDFDKMFIAKSCQVGVHRLIKTLKEDKELSSIANQIDEETQASYNKLSNIMTKWDLQKYGSEIPITFDYIKTFQENICKALATYYFEIRERSDCSS